PVVCVAIKKAGVEVEKAMAQLATGGGGGIKAFDAENKIGGLGEKRKVKGSNDRRKGGKRKRRRVIIRKRVPVERHPAAKLRETIGPVKGGAPITRIFRRARQAVSKAEQAVTESPEGNGYTRTAHNRCA